MWDTAGFPLKPLADSATLYGCPMFAPAYVGRKRWAKPTTAFRTELYGSFLRTEVRGYTNGSVRSAL
jgi:hypothetical protein